MCRSLLYLMLAASLHADVTIRYRTTVKSPEPLPDIIGAIDSPDAITIKGSMGHLTTGGFTMIVDFNAQRLTLLDAWHAKYATIPSAEYSSRIASWMPGAGRMP